MQAYAYVAPAAPITYVQPTGYVAINPPPSAVTPLTTAVVITDGEDDSWFSGSFYWFGVLIAVLIIIGLIGVIIWSFGVWFNSESSSSSASSASETCVPCSPSSYPTSSTSSCRCAPTCCKPLGCAAPNCGNGRLAWRRPPFSS